MSLWNRLLDGGTSRRPDGGISLQVEPLGTREVPAALGFGQFEPTTPVDSQPSDSVSYNFVSIKFGASSSRG
jgi:hypothetical protein